MEERAIGIDIERKEAAFLALMYVLERRMLLSLLRVTREVTGLGGRARGSVPEPA